METRTPSGSSAVPYRHSEIRRRSGGHSPRFEEGYNSSSRATYSPSFRLHLHLKPVPDLPEDDPHRPTSSDDPDVSVALDSREASLSAVVEDATIMSACPTESGVRHSEVTRPLGLYDHPLPPLPHSPGAVGLEANAVGQESSFSSIPLTPRPGGPSRLDSHGSQTSKASQRSVFSKFPRLPTPDFSASKLLHKSILAPISFLRSRAPSISSNLSFSPPLSRVRTSATENTATATNSGRMFRSSTLAQAVTRHPSRTESFKSGLTSQGSDTLYGDDSYSSFMAKAPLRFTRKFPSPLSVELRESLSDTNVFERLIASDNGDGLGVERIGRWTGYKWCLLLSVLTVFGYAIAGLVCSILVWFGTLNQADVMWVADNDILIYITLASTLLQLTSLVGLTGTLLNSRAILSFYALLLWPSFVSVLVVGYASYKREAFSLDRKLNLAWSQWYSDLGRLVIQESSSRDSFIAAAIIILYLSTSDVAHSDEATFSKNCYPRTPLPGCKGKLFQFEQANLRMCWQLAFSLVPLHVLNIIISLLCSNHVDRRFGKGLTPRAYRLTMADVRANADAILAHFSDTRLPSEPSRTYLHTTDHEDGPKFLNVSCTTTPGKG